MEEKIHEINQATKNAVATLNTTLKTRLVRLPKALKMMPLDELSRKAANEAKGEGVVSKAEKKPASRKGTARTTAKDVNAHLEQRSTRSTRSTRNTRSTRPENETTPPEGTGNAALPAIDEQEPTSTCLKEGSGDVISSHFEEAEVHASPPPVQFSRANKRAIAQTTQAPGHMPATSYNGMPLETPLPFSGKAVPLPVQMLTVQAQGKRAGGKTKASRNVPQAAVVTTKDGKQWAIGANGLRDIPESHRQEVSEYLQSQFSFLQDALGL